jgi:hypothetical protein
MLVHTYYCHSHFGIKQYSKFRFTFKLPLNSINTSNSSNTFRPKFNSYLNIDRTGVTTTEAVGSLLGYEKLVFPAALWPANQIQTFHPDLEAPSYRSGNLLHLHSFIHSMLHVVLLPSIKFGQHFPILI